MSNTRDYDPRTPGERAGAEVYEALGQSDSFLDFQERLSRAAQVNRPVLLVGERGTGKELAAQRLHYLSRRWQGPFVALNCAALAPTLIEAELFGHEEGAFTGAGRQRQGRFEAADGGTLLLDEIGNIPLEGQQKILRTVEYGTFERVGGSHPVEVDTRILGATNADLRTLVARGDFMPDLLDRLSFEVLVLPPLRDRKDDIPLLANHFAARMAMELEWAGMPEIADEAMEVLLQFDWPGNIRELKNVIERAVYGSNDMIVTPDELIFDPFENYANSPDTPEDTEHGEDAAESSSPAPHTEFVPGSQTFSDAVGMFEVGILRTALQHSKFNQRKAANMLGLTYHQFRGIYRKYQDELAE